MIDHRFNRRGFIGASSALGLGLLAGCNDAQTASKTGGQSATHPYDGILGAQLYTVRALFEADPRATLKAVADIGIKDCETAGLFDHAATDIRAMMDEFGLQSRSAHVRLPQLRDGLEKDLETASILGQDRLYLGWIAEEERTLDGYRALADLLNQRGEEAKAQGVSLGYHNHEFEFLEEAGTNGYDILLDRTDPDLVTFEIDFFWTAEAGVDPVALFEKAPGRFTSCHIKDRDKDGNMVPVGDGVIDFAGLLSHAELAGLERFYVEHDNPTDPLASIGRSYSYLTS